MKCNLLLYIIFSLKKNSYKVSLQKFLTLFYALDKWIACITWWTAADGIVVNNLTSGINTTVPKTRILTFLWDASLVLRTLRTNYTLWSARWRTTKEIGLTRAHCKAIGDSAHTIWSTRWWLTWILWW